MFFLWLPLLLMSCFHPMPAVKGACSNGAQERNKGRFRHVALGQSSCVPPGRNHMSSGAGKQSRRSCVQCMCVRMVCICAWRCVQFVHSAATEEDGRTCVGVGKTLMSTIWTAAQKRRNSSVLEEFSFIHPPFLHPEIVSLCHHQFS